MGIPTSFERKFYYVRFITTFKSDWRNDIFCVESDFYGRWHIKTIISRVERIVAPFSHPKGSSLTYKNIFSRKPKSFRPIRLPCPRPLYGSKDSQFFRITSNFHCNWKFIFLISLIKYFLVQLFVWVLRHSSHIRFLFFIFYFFFWQSKVGFPQQKRRAIFTPIVVLIDNKIHHRQKDSLWQST